MGMFDRFSQRITDAGERVSDDMSEFAGDDINALQLGGRMLGETGHVVGETMAEPINAAVGWAFKQLPKTSQDYIKKGLGDIAQGVMETDAAQSTAQYLRENPELSRDLSAMSGIIDLIPGAAVVAKGGGGKLFNSLADNFKTHNEGWYSGNPIEKAQGVAKNAPGALGMAVKTQFSPKERAIAREVGTGSRRIDEALDPPKKRTREGNIIASGYLAEQMGKGTDNIVSNLPTYTTAVRSTHAADDFSGILQGSRVDFPDDIPDGIAEDLVTRSMVTLDRPAKLLGKEKAISTIIDPRHRGRGRNPKGSTVVVRDTDAPMSRLQAESWGGRAGTKSSRAISQAFSADGLKTYANYVGKGTDDLDITDYKDFFHTASLFEGHLKDVKKGLGAETPLEYAYRKVTKGKTLREPNELAYTNPGTLLKDYFKAKKRQGMRKQNGDPYALSEKQAELIRVVDDLKRNHSPNLTIDTVDGKDVLKYRTSYNSAEQELGGVSVGMTFDPDSKNMYTQITDGHDIFGADPAGGTGLYTISPIQVRKLGEPSRNMGQAGRKNPRVAQKQDESFKYLEEKTGVKPTFDKKTGQLNAKEYESAVLSAARDQATPTAADYANSAGTGMLTGVAFTGNQPQTEEPIQ